jgi:hypothetical protein
MGVFNGSGPAHDLVIARDYAKGIGNWVNTNTNGTLAGVSAVGGGVQYTLGGADNDEGYAALNFGPCFILTAASPTGRSGSIEAVIRGTEANTNDADWFLGLSTGLLTSDGVFTDTAGTLATQDAFGIYKVADSLFFRTCALSTSTAQAGITSTTAYASATDYRIKMFWECRSSGIYAAYYVDGVLIDEVTDFAYTGMNNMYGGFALKATSANAEVLAVKSFVAQQGGA